MLHKLATHICFLRKTVQKICNAGAIFSEHLQIACKFIKILSKSVNSKN